MYKLAFAGLVLLHTLSLAQNIVIETYGDSITAGLLSYTNITQKNELSEVSRILSDFAMFKLTKNRDFLIKHEKTEIAWPTLLANHLKTDLVDYEIRNYALSGARSDSMMEEVKKAALPKDEVIAFFFIGHNDLCHNKGSEEDLARDFSRNLKERNVRLTDGDARWESIRRGSGDQRAFRRACTKLEAVVDDLL